MAFASIYVPNFMLQAAVRAPVGAEVRAVFRVEPKVGQAAMALIDGLPPVWSVVAVNEAAIQAGIELGMTKAQAAQFRGVELRQRSRLQEGSAHAALLDLAWSVSPRIEDTAPDTLVLDLGGLTSLFGGEENIATQLTERSGSLGLGIHAAISANLETAVHAARGFPGITLIPPGAEAQRLAGLPIQVLLPPRDILETLERWGVRTCGALAALPVLELSERLGQQGVRLHEWARGARMRSLILAEPTLHFEEEMELEDAVVELESLAFLLGRLLDQLCARLAARALAACAIRLRFDLEVPDGGELPKNNVKRHKTGREEHLQQQHVRQELQHGWEQQAAAKAAANQGTANGRTCESRSKIFESILTLPVPVRDSKLLLKLLRLQLQSNPPPSSIVKIILAADPAAPRVMQKGLFVPRCPDPEKMELLIARLRHVVGEANVGAPQLLDTHRPGEFRMRRFVPPGGSAFGRGEARRKSAAAATTTNGRRGKPVAGFRIFRPAAAAKVEIREGRPVRIFFQGRRGDVVAASGPWRVAGDWWREGAWQQDEWDVEVRFTASADSAASAGWHGRERTFIGDQQVKAKSVSCTGIYQLYYDALRRNWFVRGVYD